MKWLDTITRAKRFRQLEIAQLYDLSLIRQEDVNLVYCKRPVNDDIDVFVSLLIEQSFKGIDSVVTPASLGSVVTDHLNLLRMFTPGKVKLAHDIVAITQSFIRVTEADQVRLILKIVSDDACRKFHTDRYDLRLLCTYAGKGTEWIADEFVDRKKLMTGSNDDIIKDFNRVQSLDPFDVAILKGEVLSRPNTKGIVHRSPPIEQAGEKRLLLRIDY